METQTLKQSSAVPPVVVSTPDKGSGEKDSPKIDLNVNPLDKLLQPKYRKLESLYLAVVNCEEKYFDKLKAFAEQCFEVWKVERKQGSRKGQGFEAELKKRNIPKGRAYRAMEKYCPEYLALKPPKQPRSLRTKSEVLQLALPVRGATRDEFKQFMSILGEEKATSIMYEALKQAVARGEAASPKKTFNDEPEMSGDGETILSHMQQKVAAAAE